MKFNINGHDLVVATLITLFFALLSIPYQFEFNYGAESPILWVMYFFVGAILVIYIFYTFLQDWRHLMHEGGESP